MNPKRLRPSDSLSARVTSATPLRYAAGADPATDRPTHVRAASGVARVGGRLAVVQDDANFVALIDPATGLAEAVALPAGEGRLRQFDDLRGNKEFKLDLEACVSLVDRNVETLVALGSGSSPRRERIAVVRGLAGPSPEVEMVDAPSLYAALRGARDFAGSEMNLEGAVAVGRALRLFGRGNGAARDGLEAVNATCDLDLDRFLAYLRDPSIDPPLPENVAVYDLGEIGGCRLGFTDAALRDGRIFFAAAAEDSPDAIQDGPVAGSTIGVIDGDGGRWALLREADGAPFTGKVEGLWMRGATSAWIVVDRDDPERPSELCEVELGGFGGE